MPYSAVPARFFNGFETCDYIEGDNELDELALSASRRRHSGRAATPAFLGRVESAGIQRPRLSSFLRTLPLLPSFLRLFPSTLMWLLNC